MSGTASDVAGTMSAKIISNITIDRSIVIAATRRKNKHKHGHVTPSRARFHRNR